MIKNILYFIFCAIWFTGCQSADEGVQVNKSPREEAIVVITGSNELGVIRYLKYYASKKQNSETNQWKSLTVAGKTLSLTASKSYFFHIKDINSNGQIKKQSLWCQGVSGYKEEFNLRKGGNRLAIVVCGKGGTNPEILDFCPSGRCSSSVAEVNSPDGASGVDYNDRNSGRDGSQSTGVPLPDFSPIDNNGGSQANNPRKEEEFPKVAGKTASMTLLEWNVYYENKDIQGIANVISKTNPDIVGLCELTASVEDMATSLSLATGRNFRVQPGRKVWKGYGTDIFYDSNKWDALEGGVETVNCEGTRGGDRAANWVVLKERASGKLIITGGIHLSYCQGGCEATHICEVGRLYSKFDAMKSKYNSAAVIWMGDLNHHIGSSFLKSLKGGMVTGGQKFLETVDVVMTNEITYYTGGTIDFILAEEGKFVRVGGGSTRQGQKGQRLNGADHFPVFSKVNLK